LTTWSAFLQCPKRSFRLLLLLVGAVGSTILFSHFLVWNETRPGAVFNDPILQLFQPVDMSLLTGLLTNLSIFFCILLILRKPLATVYMFAAAILICILRASSLYLVVLEPPVNIIPLADPLLEATFYRGSALLKDLFFSGHTANIILIGLLAEQVFVKRIMIIIACIVGALLMIQHVHYSIDVLAAPVFAVVTYKLSVHIGNRYFLYDIEEGKRCGCILREAGLSNN
jgi:hypothetical protein